MLARINKRFPTFFEDLIGREFLPDFYEANGFKSLPAVNIVEGDDSFTIEVAAPGLDKKDFQVDLENNFLTISSEKEQKSEETNEKYARKEFNYSTFRRSFTLPETVNSEKIQASHKDGILYVKIPKKDEAKVKPARQIAVS
jgi:HSP20 family protein